MQALWKFKRMKRIPPGSGFCFFRVSINENEHTPNVIDRYKRKNMWAQQPTAIDCPIKLRKHVNTDRKLGTNYDIDFSPSEIYLPCLGKRFSMEIWVQNEIAGFEALLEPYNKKEKKKEHNMNGKPLNLQTGSMVG